MPPRRRRSDDFRLLEVPTPSWVSSILRYAPPAENEDGELQPPGGVRIPGGALVTYLPNDLTTIIGQFAGERTEPPRELQMKARALMVFREGHSMKWNNQVTPETWNLSSVYNEWWINFKWQLSDIWDDTRHYVLLRMNKVRPNSYIPRSATDAHKNQLLADQECELSQEFEQQCVGFQIGRSQSLYCNRLNIKIMLASVPTNFNLRDVMQWPEVMQTLSLFPSELLQPSRGFGVSLDPVQGGGSVNIYLFGQDLVRSADVLHAQPKFDATASARSLYTGAASASRELSPINIEVRNTLSQLPNNCMFSQHESLTSTELIRHNHDNRQWFTSLYVALSDASLEHDTEFTIMIWKLTASQHKVRHIDSVDNIDTAARDCASYFVLKDEELFNHRFWDGELNVSRLRNVERFIFTLEDNNVIRIQIKSFSLAQSQGDDESLLRHPTVEMLCLTFTQILQLDNRHLSVVIERDEDGIASVNFLLYSPRFVRDCQAASVARDAEPYSATTEVLAALRRHRLVRPRDLVDDMQALQLQD